MVDVAFETNTHDSDAKLLLLALSQFANEQGVCSPPLDRLMQMTNLEADALLSALDTLQQRRLVQRHSIERADGRAVWKLRL